ncbi:MAG: hypothetical protein U5L03_04250 [Burkholderiaceae bacterium]|nr:hypothetical protein [Burkholderiaceae bacterium]
MKEPPHPVLAQGKVRYVGDHVAVVVAETLDQARDAAELVEVDYEVLPAVADTATADGAAAVHDKVAGQRLLRLGLRRQGRDRCRLCQGGARDEARVRQQPADPRTRWSRARRSATTTARPASTRCSPPARTRTSSGC